MIIKKKKENLIGIPYTLWILFSLKFLKPHLYHAFGCFGTSSCSVTRHTKICVSSTCQALVLQMEFKKTGKVPVFEAFITD